MIYQYTNKQSWQIAGLILTLLFAFFASTSSVGAQTNNVERITLSPVSKRLQVKAGTQATGSFTVINDGRVAYDFKVYASPYYVKNEQYEPLFTEAGQRDASKWVQFAKTTYRLEPGQRIDVPYTVLIPESAAPGGHYAVLFAETQAQNRDTTGVGRNKRVGSVLLANVEGQVTRGGEVVADTTPFLQLSPPLQAFTRVRNSGNVDFDAKVTLQVRDVFGRLKHQSENTFVVFPETTRRTQVPWNQAPIIGLFKVDQSVEFLDRSEQTSKYVLIMPSWVIIGVLIALAAGIGSLVLKRKSTKR